MCIEYGNLVRAHVNIIMKKRPTIKDIAKKAGVTHSTVSRVINNNPAISEETKARVLGVMRELKYEPNLIARSLVTNKTKALAFVAPELNPHVLPILRGVVDTCKRLNYGLMLFSTDYWTHEKQSYMEVVRNWLVDGILIYNVIYHENTPENIKELMKEKVPFVFINKFLNNPEINNVSIDNFDAVHKGIEHLVNLGHKKIAVINGGMLSVDGVERFGAYKQALNKFDLEFDEQLVGCGNFFYHEAYEEMKRFLTLKANRPTAVFCANDLMAIAAADVIKAYGLRVPEDIAVMGIDDLEAGRYHAPAITTLKPPHEDIGAKAIDLVLKLVDEPEQKPQQIPLYSRLIVRESTVAK